MWKSWLKGFERYLRLERNAAKNTVESYLRDLEKFAEWASRFEISAVRVSPMDIREYLKEFELLAQKTQSRHLASLRHFFNWLKAEKARSDNPTDLIENPKHPQYLPDFLSFEEIESIIFQIDKGTPTGQRNWAMLEVLYGCGIRVSELVTMRVSDIYEKEGFVRVVGKGNKERIVPINKTALKAIKIYRDEIRVHQEIVKGHEDTLFLNSRGAGLTRVMVFTIVKTLCQKAGIKKKVSPHTFRHSFATHLVQNGANLRVVQEMLGHESILTTEIYTHLDTADLRNALNKYHPRAS